jgi:hypothetical protein
MNAHGSGLTNLTNNPAVGAGSGDQARPQVTGPTL